MAQCMNSCERGSLINDYYNTSKSFLGSTPNMTIMPCNKLILQIMVIIILGVEGIVIAGYTHTTLVIKVDLYPRHPSQ